MIYYKNKTKKYLTSILAAMLSINCLFALSYQDAYAKEAKNITAEGGKTENSKTESSKEENDKKPTVKTKSSLNQGKKMNREAASLMISIKENEKKKAYLAENSMEKLIKINKTDKEIINLNMIDFSNKKIACLGDSITYGVGGSDDGEGGKINYGYFLEEILNAKEVTTYGEGGMPLGDGYTDGSLINRFENIPKDTDIVIVFGGVNDFFIGKEYFGDMETKEDNTYCGSVNEMMQEMTVDYPKSDIFFVTTYKNSMEQVEKFDGNLNDYMEVQRNLAEEYNINIIELYATGFMDMNIPEIKNLLGYDSIHPNDAGSMVLAQHFAAELISYYRFVMPA